MDCIVVIDFGAQYAHLIARCIRELGVYSEIIFPDTSIEDIERIRGKFNVKGIVLSGGPSSVYLKNAPKCSKEVFNLNLPILGICYGHQLIAYTLGGEVRKGYGEYGITYVTIEDHDEILKDLNRVEKVWMSHSDVVVRIPNDFKKLAYSKYSPYAAIKHKFKKIYGVQWHPEVIHTVNGLKIFKNFIFNICNCNADWRVEDFIERSINEIKSTVGNSKCIIALSGGVDSSTAAVLTYRAIGSNLTAVLVDHGFMREGEVKLIKDTFRNIGLNLMVIDAQDRFLKKLNGITDPELKRKIIGEEFIRIFEEVAKSIGAEYLIQGTIYPDRIESGFRKYSDKIKTHHNVGGLPLKIEFKKIIEPLKDLYKDEVRRIALKLGIPKEIVFRQPFPGPGLAIRIIGEVTKEKLEIVRKATKIVEEEIENSRLRNSLWQYFAVLTNTMTTGVKGDARAYGYCLAIRVVESREAMTASFAKIPFKILEKISTRITSEIPQIVRVVYDITHKPPGTIEWE